MCEHAVVHDYVLLGGAPVLLLRQCVDCRWWTRVFGAEFEPPPPGPEQVLRDIARWRAAREAHDERARYEW